MVRCLMGIYLFLISDAYYLIDISLLFEPNMKKVLLISLLFFPFCSNFLGIIYCCGADKHVDPANDLSLMRASKDSQKQ